MEEEFLFERLRGSLETVERLEGLAAALLLDPARTHRERLRRAHLVSRIVGRIAEASRSAQSLQAAASAVVAEDSNSVKTNVAKLDGAAGLSAHEAGRYATLRAELESIKCVDGREDYFAEFDKRMPALLAAHQANPRGAAVEPVELSLMSTEASAVDDAYFEKMFSGEERYGKYLDLHCCYSMLLQEVCCGNAGIETHFAGPTVPFSATYLGYLRELLFSVFQASVMRNLNIATPLLHEFKWPDSQPNAEMEQGSRTQLSQHMIYLQNYRTYLHTLCETLGSFVARAYPLFDFETFTERGTHKFNQRWNQLYSGDPLKWYSKKESALFCQHCEGYCVACKRIFNTRRSRARHFRDKSHTMAEKKFKASSPSFQEEMREGVRASLHRRTDEVRNVVLLEYKAQRLCKLLLRELVATIEYVERKQTLTEAELQAEVDRNDDDDAAEGRRARQTRSQVVAAAKNILAAGGRRVVQRLNPPNKDTASNDAASSDQSAIYVEDEDDESEFQVDCGTIFEEDFSNGKRDSARKGDGANADINGNIGEDDDGNDDDVADGSGRVYNPLRLPLGWDGKPIPYWLYKLHGLGVEYPCEICGNFVYKGRKVFERHFQEWRHAHGMRCLGIPNTKHFYEITQIEDAQALWARLCRENEQQFRQNVDAEFEDSQGNVFNRKTYEDLYRQGLL